MQGFNIYALLGRFKKESKLKPDIPDEVVMAICNEHVKYKDQIKNQWPWFLKVLTMKSHEYFANQNIREHEENKKQQPTLLAEIMRRANRV